MKKICRNCNLYYNESDIICSECGRPLEIIKADAPGQGVPSQFGMPGGGNVTQDNRMHRGDKIDIGGDNIHATNVDQSTTTTNTTNTTNTTINNIQNREELVKCSISGRWVPKRDAYECPVCKRTVSVEHYVSRKRMCEDCAEEAEKKALEETLHKSSGNSAPQQNKIPPVMPSNHPTEPITITPIKSGNDNKDKYLMAGIVAVVLLIIVGGAGMWYIGSKDEAVQPSPVVETVSQTSENQQETPPSNSSSVRQPATQVRPESNVQAETPAPAAQVTEKEVKQEKPDPFAQGKQAYEAQNYSAAKIFLEQAFNEGSPQAGYYLAQLYMKGNGVSKSVQKAFDNMKVAAEGGYKEAFFELAEMYRLGIGTEPNRALAQKWYEESVKSAASNADKAGKALSMFN